MRLKNLQVVERPQRLLRALDGADGRGGALHTRVERHLQRIAQFLGRNPHAMQLLRRVDVSRLVDRRGQRFRSVDEPRTERITPLFGVRVFQRVAHRRQPAFQLLRVDLFHALQHHRAPVVALGHDMCAHLFEGDAR